MKMMLATIFLVVLTQPMVGAETLKLKITGIEEISHVNDKDECGVADLPCHTREEYKVTAHNTTIDFVLSCETDYLSYLNSKTEISYIPADKPMKVCILSFHAGDTITFRSVRGGWIPDDGVKDDAMQVFTVTSEKEFTAKSK